MLQQKKSIKIEQQKGRLSSDEIDRIVKEAEKFKSEDDAKKAKVDAKNSLENVVFQAKNQFAKKIPSLSKYCDKQLLWLEQNPEASVNEYQAKIKEVQDWIAAEVQKSGGIPQNEPQNPSESPKSNMPDIDEID